MKRIIKDSVLLRTCAVLVALLLVSLYLASGYLAKYVSDNDTDEGSGIASFDFIINNGETIELDLSSIKAPGDSEEFTFRIASPDTNEVRVEHLVRVDSSNNLPLEISVTPAGESSVSSEAEKGTGIVYNIQSLTTVEPNVASTETFTVTVEWPATARNVSYSGMNEAVCVSVSGTQVV